MIEVTNVVRAFPEAGEGRTGIDSIVVKSHWNDGFKVVLMVEGCSITLYAKDLITAINNSINTGKF